MRYFIDGTQLSGKSTLLENSGIESYRFAFDTYVNALKLNDKNSLNGFQIGKDLGILFGLSSNMAVRDILFDRGPFSTLYYSILDKRMSDEQVDEFLEKIAEFTYNTYIFVVGTNQPEELNERNKKDNFDYLKKLECKKGNEILNQLVEKAHKHKIHLWIFRNDFSKSIEENVENFKYLLGAAKNEYLRS